MGNEVIKILDNLSQKFGIAIDWSSQNVMPYLQELINRYVQYSITETIIFLIIESIGVFIFIWILINGIKNKRKDNYWEWTDEGVGGLITLVILGTILAIAIPVTIDLLLKGIYTPEILILNYIKGF